jgi:serine/threonine protein kinase
MKLNHPNIANVLDFHGNATWQKSDGSSTLVACIILELVENGELFDYVATAGVGGPLPESIVRFYFR